MHGFWFGEVEDLETHVSQCIRGTLRVPEGIRMDTAIFDGIEYYWDGRYYTRHKGVPVPIRAHRELWMEAFGPIPEGYHIHHLDENRRNNSLSNLLVVKASEHTKGHMQDEGRKEQVRKNMQIACEAAKIWHSSEEGKQWHRKQFERVMEQIGSKICDECGITYTPANFRQRFCQSKCGNRFKMREWRKRKGIKATGKSVAFITTLGSQ